MKTLDEMIAEQPLESQREIAQRLAELVAEEMALRELRKAQKSGRAHLARKLKIRQSDVALSEQQADLYLSTLRRAVEAMGGTLTLVAQFPNQPPVKVTGFSDLAA